MALLKRLQTDQSLARYAGWFIPLKIETRGEDWQKWASKYRHEGNGIPIVFVVRADGEQLFGKSGSLPGPALPLMLQQVLSQSGTIYNDRQLAVLASSVDKAQQALDAEREAEAVTALTQLSQLGTLGNLGSYAAAAVQADSLVQDLIGRARERLAPVQQQLADASSRLEGALALLELRRVYRPLPEVREELDEAFTAARSNPEWRETMDVAELLDQARQWIDKPSGQRRATTILNRILAEHAGTPAAELAAKWLLENYPDQLSADPEMDDTRSVPAQELPVWKSTSGHAVRAALVSYRFDPATQKAFVTLKPATGEPVEVDFAQLDADSQTQAKRLVRQLQSSE